MNSDNEKIYILKKEAKSIQDSNKLFKVTKNIKTIEKHMLLLDNNYTYALLG